MQGLSRLAEREVSLMPFYNFLSSVLSYIFTFILYLFIFGVIRLSYLDIRKMNRFENESVNVSGAASASLRPLHN